MRPPQVFYAAARVRRHAAERGSGRHLVEEAAYVLDAAFDDSDVVEFRCDVELNTWQRRHLALRCARGQSGQKQADGVRPLDPMSAGQGPDAVVVVGYETGQRAAALDLAIRAWEPVFPRLRAAVPRFVYDSFYPDGWRTRQLADLAEVLDEEPAGIDVALIGGVVVGWVCTRIHAEDSMGEIYVIAVDPDHQRRGVGRALMERAHERARRAGMRMVMVETGGDPGHAPARASYEAAGYERWPVARYFRDLTREQG